MTHFTPNIRVFAALVSAAILVGCGEAETAAQPPVRSEANDFFPALGKNAEPKRLPDPAPFTPDPEAVQARELGKACYIAEMQGSEARDKLEARYKDEVVTLEGVVAAVEPYGRTGLVGLYGFEITDFDPDWPSPYHFGWDEGGAIEQTREKGWVFLYSGGSNGSPRGSQPYDKPLREALQHGQRVRVRGRVGDARRHRIDLEQVEYLAVSPVPAGLPAVEQYVSEEKVKAAYDRNDELAKPLEALDVSVYFGESLYDGYGYPNVSLDREEHYGEDGAQIRPAIIEELKKFEDLQLQLEFTYLWPQDAMLEQVAQLQNLRSLHIRLPRSGSFLTGENGVTPAGLAKLAKLTNLVHLEIGEDGNDFAMLPASPELNALKALKQLRVLRLRNVALDDESLAFLEELSGLYELALGGGDVTDAALPDWSRHPELRVLDLTGTSVTTAGLAGLEQCPRLRKLALADTDIDAEIFSLIERLPELGFLDLSGLQIGATDLGVLKDRPLITHVSVDRTAVGDAAMRTLAGLPLVRFVSVRETQVTDDGVRLFKTGSGELRIECSPDQVSKEAAAEVMQAREKVYVSREQ